MDPETRLHLLEFVPVAICLLVLVLLMLATGGPQ